jgi:very-short-patch-repair endonuclease
MKKFDHNSYNRNLQPFENKLRKRMTKAEVCLWKYALSARQMKGYQFRRQRPVMNFIVDFMCQPLRLIIEVDGYTHLSPVVERKDRLKDKTLTEAGFKILRFTDALVLKDMTAVIQEIEYEMSLLECPPPSRKRDTPASGR